ncbi:hypothetical protein NMY22_g11989 [Coprinellus aureogranulatus]|nr:hypothetical protein NMY22_g11989 [Coprinellus aureogranulatus]
MSNASIPQAFRLMDLPPEIVQKILIDYQNNGKRLRKIRLVCRQINECVQDEALRSLDLSLASLTRLELMTYEAQCIPQGYDDPDTATNYRSDCGAEHVTSSMIKKMERLRIVHWDLSHTSIPPKSRCPPCIYDALSSVPSLEKIVIQPREGCGNILLGAKLKNPLLNSISISRRTSTTEAITGNLQELVATHTNLEELESWDQPGFTGNGLDFSAIVGATPYRPGFRPSLRVLHARNLQLVASPAVLKYLACLTTLSISNSHHDHDTLWPAFHLCGIMLKTLSIERPTERLTDYLLEYCGLEQLSIKRFRRDPRTAVTNDTKLRFLEQGVAHHRDSLARIDIIFYPCPQERHVHLVLWAVNESQIAWLEGFPKLTSLTVSFAHDGERAPKGTNIGLGQALNGLCTRLSSTVQQVELVCGTSGCYGKPRVNHSDLGIIRSMRSFEFTGSPRNPEMRLKIYDATWKILYDQTRGTYRFVLETTEAEEDER